MPKRSNSERRDWRGSRGGDREVSVAGHPEPTTGDGEAASATQQAWSHRQWTPLARALAATGDRWTLLIVLALGSETLRLNRLRERLPGISAGVLDHHVQQMAALGLLTRARFREVPPRVELELTDSGRDLVPLAAALARWGMRRAWPPPAGAERVDINVLLETLPALLEDDSDLVDGAVEAVLMSADGRARHLFSIHQGRLGAARCVGPTTRPAKAGMEGDEAAWIMALGPARDYSGLHFTGEKQLARQVLDALPHPA